MKHKKCKIKTNTDAGDVETGIAFFNHANDTSGDSFGEDMNNSKENLSDATIQYKGFTIEKLTFGVEYPLDDFVNGKPNNEVDYIAYIIHSPYVLKNSGFHLPLYCEDEDGNVIDFKSLEEAKNWIDKYKDKFKIKIKHGDEIHAEIIEESINNHTYTYILLNARR